MIPRLGRTRGLFADWYCERTYDPRPMPVGHKPAPGDNSHEHSTPLKSEEPAISLAAISWGSAISFGEPPWLRGLDATFGAVSGTPREPLDCASGRYLNEPEAWLDARHETAAESVGLAATPVQVL